MTDVAPVQHGVVAPSEKRAPSVVITPQRGLFALDLGSVWEYRELLYFLVWRNVKVRYKQTVIGAAWIILQPLITMAILTVIFGYAIRMPSDGLPYPLFVLAGLLPWTCTSLKPSPAAAPDW